MMTPDKQGAAPLLQNPQIKNFDHGSIGVTFTLPTKPGASSSPDDSNKSHLAKALHTIEITTKETQLKIETSYSLVLDWLSVLSEFVFQYACTLYLISVMATTALKLLLNNLYLANVLHPILPYFLHVSLALRLTKQLIDFVTGLGNDEQNYQDCAMTAISILATGLIFTSSYLALPTIALYLCTKFCQRIWMLQKVNEETAAVHDSLAAFVREDYREKPSSLAIHLSLFRLNMLQIQLERKKLDLCLEGLNILCFLVINIPSIEFKIVGQVLLFAYALLELTYRHSTLPEFQAREDQVKQNFEVTAHIAFEDDLREGRLNEKNEDILQEYAKILLSIHRDNATESGINLTSSTHAEPQGESPEFQATCQ